MAGRRLLRNISIAAVGVAFVILPGRLSGAREQHRSNTLRTSGIIAFDLGHYDEAISDFQAALAVDQDPLVLYLLARAYRLANRPEQALRARSAFLQASSRSGATSVPLPSLVSELEAIVLQFQPRTAGTSSGKQIARENKETTAALSPVKLTQIEPRTVPLSRQDAPLSLELAPIAEDSRRDALQGATVRGERRLAGVASSCTTTTVAWRSAPAGPDPMLVVKDRDNAAALRACYDRALKRGGFLPNGRLNVTATIATSGAVQAVSVEAPVALESVSSCIKNVVRHWHFPSMSGESQFSFPLIVHAGGRVSEETR